MNEKARKEAALEFVGVTHRYGRTPSVEGVSFSVDTGETVCLLGPSGCGKTTLLRLAGGLEAPGEGEIRIGGAVAASGRRMVPPEKRPISMVFQDYALFPHLNVLQNIVFGLKKVAPEERYRRARGVLERVGLSAEADRFPHALSGGQQQRVALARAIALKPAVMLMDEPFSNLDINLRFAVREETRRILRSEGSATLLVTHDAEEATQLADRIVLLDRGRVVQAGAPEDFYFRPATPFAARFFGETTSLGGLVGRGELVCPLGRWPAAPGAREGPVEIVVRDQAFLFRRPAAEEMGHCRRLEARILESRMLGGRRVTDFTIGGDEVFRAFHRITTRLQFGEVRPCWLDTRLAFAFPAEK